MIAKLLKALVGGGKQPPPPPPVGVEDLFADSDAPAYDESSDRRTSSITIAPRAAEADLATLEAPLPPPTTAEDIPTGRTSPSGGGAKKAEAPKETNNGWDSLSFGD
ncbi:hypothetical protein GC173_14900 [bacterium]|nr:hypothetical protein [bacterium]